MEPEAYDPDPRASQSPIRHRILKAQDRDSSLPALLVTVCLEKVLRTLNPEPNPMRNPKRHTDINPKP